ncbi:MAG: oxidoreductase, partial [Armatimonadetes bacterium]|nr:oxidoreductase [Armatimonadota bacterium]
LCGRFAADYRTRGAWGLWRHAIPHPLLIEGAVHHFDQLRNLSCADCAQLTGWDWQPAWSSFDHQSSALFVLTMTSGARASYEANCSEAGWTNPWHREYYRAECEHGTLVLDQDNVVRIMVHDSAGKDSVEVVGPVKPPFAHGHQVQIAQFLDWREGGPTPDAVLPDNLKSVAMVFAAMQASEENRVVDVTALVAQAG